MIGDKLRELRTLKGYTLKQLGKLSGVSYVQITRYENNRANPTQKTINKLAKALSVDIGYLKEKDKESTHIKDEVLDEKYSKLKKIMDEDDSGRKTLADIFDLMTFKKDINQLLMKNN